MVQAAGGAVVLGVPQNLRRLVAELPGLAYLGASGEPMPRVRLAVPADESAAGIRHHAREHPRAGSLSARFRRRHGTRRQHWRGQASGLRVGIAWAGSPTHLGDRFRSLPFALLRAAAGCGGGAVLLAATGAGGDAVGECAEEAITDLAPAIGDLADTAALMRAARPGDRGRYRGGASGRCAGTAGVGDAAVLPGLALDARTRGQPLVPDDAALPATSSGTGPQWWTVRMRWSHLTQQR